MNWLFDELVAQELQSKQRRRPSYKEDELQKACVRWFDLQYPQMKEVMHHSPNEGKRSEKMGAKLKAMGMRPGFPDLVLLRSTSKYEFLAIELKADGYQSKAEKHWQEVAEKNGGLYVVIRTVDDFMELVKAYINAVIHKNTNDEERYSENLEAVVRRQVRNTRRVKKGGGTSVPTDTSRQQDEGKTKKE